jgi:hypothetical protein
MDFLRLQDRIAPDGLSEDLDASTLLGTWVSTQSDSPGIDKLVISRDGPGELKLEALSAGDQEPRPWEAVRLQALYGDAPDATEVWAFIAECDWGFAKVSLQGNLTQGLLVLAIFTTFTDDSGRSDFLAREFYYRSD